MKGDVTLGRISMLLPNHIVPFSYIIIHQWGCDSQPLILPHALTRVSPPAATAEREKGTSGFSGSQCLLTCRTALLSSRTGGFLGIRAACLLHTSPASWQKGTRAPKEWWGLGKRSTPNSFVLFDLHLKYIWKAAETLTLNRLPTQMFSTKELPGIIILSIYQFVTRIWHILSLKVRNNNFPPWRLGRDRILLQMLNSHDYQPGIQIPNTKLLTSAQQLPCKKFISMVTNT